MGQDSNKRVTDVIQRLGPTAVALVRLALDVWLEHGRGPV